MTDSLSATGKRPSSFVYIVVLLVSATALQLIVSHFVIGAASAYFRSLPALIATLLVCCLLGAILTAFKAFTRARVALWSPAAFGFLVTAGLIALLAVNPDRVLPVFRPGVWMLVAWALGPPVLTAVWFELMETFRLRRYRSI